MVASISLRTALRFGAMSRVAITGAGGKTSLLFRLAKEYQGPVLLSTSTHLGSEQAMLADHHYVVHDPTEIEAVFQAELQEIMLFTGDQASENRLQGLSFDLLEILSRHADQAGIPLLIEADGSRRLPLKAPASHEPAIPAWVDHVIVVAGLSGIGQPLTAEHVHRPERFGELSGLAPGEKVTTQALQRVLLHPQGGLKNIPDGARKSLVLNQADTDYLRSIGGKIAVELLAGYDEVLVASLSGPVAPVKAVFSPVAGVILAAGRSQRMGKPGKVVLDWQGEPFVRRVARTALEAGLRPVTIVTGAAAEQVKLALAGLPVEIVHNEHWEEGQGTSIACGVRGLPAQTGAAIFLLADQPQVSRSILAALVETHRTTLASIIAPMIEDRRANPVLFDRIAFDGLSGLSGDVGGRALFSKYPVLYLPWNDAMLLLDVDTPEDYQKLLDAYHARTDASPQ